VETERELLDAIRKGDRAAMRRLYERYKGYAMAIGLRYIPNSDEMHDVLQDSFVKIITGISRFDYRGEGSLKSWVSRIVANQAINYIRDHERFHFTDEMPDDRIDEEPDIGEVSDEVLDGLIGQLPANYRVVLNLFVFEQLSHREIAQQLGISEKNSATQFFRAKRALQKMIIEYKQKRQRI
jgi:RNA polymerase sigma-70 factor (ECF subfamily)